MLTYVEEPPRIKLLNHLTTWSSKISSKAKTILSPPPSIYGNQTLQVRDLPSEAPIHLVTWPFLHVVWKSYFYYHKKYGHQTWQGGDILWGASIQKVAGLNNP